MNAVYKSPMNYIGNKYRVLNQILPLFPACNTFVDLFAGGLDVSINYAADTIYCNDINGYLIDIYKAFQHAEYEQLLEHFDRQTKLFDLSKTNKSGYLQFRDYYNSSERNPLDLYLLMNYSFNYQLRFNAKHDYNTPFGENRSSFNQSLKSRLRPFIDRIANINFSAVDFRLFDYTVLNQGDLVYCDPPYLISTGSYNDGKRGFNGWTKADDIDLMRRLDELNKRGVKFAFSNFLEHKGLTNTELVEWAENYTIHEVSRSYDNCSYHTENKKHITREVLITNE